MRREEWDQLFTKGPCIRCSWLEAKKKRLKKWEKTTDTKIQHIHFYSNAGANVARTNLIPAWDHSGCVNCTFICKNVKYINDAFPGLRSVIEQRNKHHLEYASGDGNQGRIPGQYNLMRCEVGKGSGWSYNKCLPAYSEESNQKFSAALKAAKWLGEEESEKQREFIDYYKDRPERLNRIKNGDITALYEHESQDYYKLVTIRKKLRTYYEFPVTIERSHCETCHANRAYVLLEGESTLGKWPGPVDKYPNPLYSIAGIYERSKEKHPHPSGLQVFDEDYETSEDEYGEYEIDGPGILEKKEGNLSWGLVSRDKERDPGDYAIANDGLELEYEGDTRGVSDRKDESYVNELPYRKKTDNKKPASISARTARDGFGSSYPILGTCSECGGDLAKGLPVWNGHANKHIIQDFIDIHRDDIVCLQCGLIHKFPADGPTMTPAIERCLLDGTLQDEMSIYVPFDLELYEKSKAERVRSLKEYYMSNPDAKKQPKNTDLVLPRRKCYKKHDRLTLEDPENGLQTEQIKRRQIVRIFTEMWPREELPDDPIKAVLNSSINKRRFSRVFKDLYGEELSNKAVEDRMIMAQRYSREKVVADVKKKFEWMRKHNRPHDVKINLYNFIKS